MLDSDNSNDQESAPIADNTLWVDPKTLHPHPLSILIYGEEDDVSELMELIKSKGWITPLVVTPDNQIISGHRRWKSAINLELDLVPVQIIEFSDERAELERLLMENAKRNKNREQQVREGRAWEAILKPEFRSRSIANLIQGKNKPEKPANDIDLNNPPERLRDRVASLVGLKGRSYEKGSRVVQLIDEQKDLGNHTEGQALSRVLNKESIDAAYSLIKLIPEARTEVLNLVAKGRSSKDALATVRTRKARERNRADKAAEKAKREVEPSCWNCQNRGENIDNASFYCYLYGVISFTAKDVVKVAADCGGWRERTTSPDKADYNNSTPDSFMLNVRLPIEWLTLLKERASMQEATLEEWVRFELGALFFAKESSKSEAIIYQSDIKARNQQNNSNFRRKPA